MPESQGILIVGTRDMLCTADCDGLALPEWREALSGHPPEESSERILRRSCMHTISHDVIWKHDYLVVRISIVSDSMSMCHSSDGYSALSPARALMTASGPPPHAFVS